MISFITQQCLHTVFCLYMNFSPFSFPDTGETKMLSHIRFKTLLQRLHRFTNFITRFSLTTRVCHFRSAARNVCASRAQKMMVTVVPTSLLCGVAQRTSLKTVTCTMMSIHFSHRDSTNLRTPLKSYQYYNNILNIY